MTVTATRRIQFCAGHRVHKHESKCNHLHGHNYVAFFTAIGTQEALDGLGRVIDFSVLKERLGGWVDENWDHGFIVHNEDERAIAALAMIDPQKIYVMQDNPTAENMAAHLLHEIGPEVLADTGVTLVKVVLWETENCQATVTLHGFDPLKELAELGDALDDSGPEGGGSIRA